MARPGWRLPRAAAIAFLTLVLHSQATAADDAVEMVVDLLDRDNAELRAVALDRIRAGVKGEAATRVFTAILENRDASRQAELVRALGSHGDVSVLPAFIGLLGQPPTRRCESRCSMRSERWAAPRKSRCS